MIFKKLLLGIAILSFIGGRSFAKAPVPVSRFDLTTSVFCGQTKGLMDVIENDINEETVFIGMMPITQNVSTLFLNKATGEWSLLISEKSGISCIYFSGAKGLLIEEDKEDTKKK